MVSNEFQISLSTIEIGVGGKYITTYIGILDLPGCKYNIVKNIIARPYWSV